MGGYGGSGGEEFGAGIPAKIRAAPARERGPRRSWRKSREVSQAKTGSSVRRSAVWTGGRCCWAQLWMVKAAAVARRLVTARAIKRRGVMVMCGVPPRGRVMTMMTVAKPIWSVASWAAGRFCEAWARVRRCPAKAMAQARVRRSPMPMVERISRGWVPAGVVRRRSPVKASRAPRRHSSGEGGFRWGGRRGWR